MSIKLVIFDLDGTLVDSIIDLTHALNYATKPFGIRERSVDEMRDLVGTGISIVIDKVLAEKGELKEKVLARFLDYYWEHLVDYTPLYPGVEETLQSLEGYKKAVVTNKREKFAKKGLNELGVGHYFDAILGSDSVGKKKPSPEPILHLLKMFDLVPGEAVMVGDSEIDMAAGKAAGVRTVGVTYGYRGRKSLIDADFVIDDLLELSGLIERSLSD
ncbi:MAG: HAD-IA family hydrolase [Deltaproteobacteria bacterium]|nr:HAD-IA family hydrolase [Deltaproteobacteria bacterium]